MNKLSVTAQRLETIVHADTLKRHRYDQGAGMALSAVALQNIALHSEPAEVIADKLAALDRYRAQVDADKTHQVLGMKGISVTLGYVDQYGVWEKGKELDHIFRQLPASAALHKRGFRFDHTYGDKEKSALSYGFQLVNTERGTSIMGVRKRAAADISSENGDEIEIVKRTSFLVDYEQLTDEQRDMTMPVLRQLFREKGRASPELQSEMGERLIEPFVSDQSVRDASRAVLPASSTYFALHRVK